jgi:P-type E1-E2 ATPase
VRLLDGAALSEDDVLSLAASAEQLSEHPYARAIVSAARARGLGAVQLDLTTAQFRAVAGKGIAARVPHAGEARHVLVGRPEFLAEEGVAVTLDGQLQAAERDGHTALTVAVDGRPTALLSLADEVRPGAREAIQRLRAAGVKRIVLLTGDRAASARAIAREVGLAEEDVRAGLLPEDKVAEVKRLQAAGHTVAMIGDGVNDAPALAAANVAIAMGAAGTDVALAAADVALMTDDIRQAADAIALSRKTVSTVRQNLVFAAVWNVAAVALAAIGSFGPVTGALVHNLGSVAVVINAARLVTTRLR